MFRFSLFIPFVFIGFIIFYAIIVQFNILHYLFMSSIIIQFNRTILDCHDGSIQFNSIAPHPFATAAAHAAAAATLARQRFSPYRNINYENSFAKI